MTNYGAKILNASISGLAAQQAVIAATSNNIANVNTPGYSRRVVNLQTNIISGSSAGVNVGDGVDVQGITRMTDMYLERLLKGTISDKSSYGVQSDILKRLDSLFSLDSNQQTIGTSLTSFFTAANDLAANPANIELRSNLIERATDLVNSIKSTFSSIAQLQTEVDQRLSTEVDGINSLTAQIAKLNGAISAQEGGSGKVAADERDRRNQLMNQLAEKVGISSVELPDGSVTVTLNGGFTLVSGNASRSLEVKQSPSFTTPPLPESLDGRILSYVVYNYSSGGGQADIDLSQKLASGGGTVGGLLSVRGYADPSNTSPFQATGPLVEVASRIEALTRSLLQNINRTYLGPSDENSTTPGYFDPSSGDLDGNPPSVYGLFDFNYTGTKDVNSNGLPDDLDILSPSVGNFSSLLQLTTTDPRKICAALDNDSADNSKSFVKGDGRNIQAIADLNTAQYTFSAGSFSLTGTFDDLYNEAVVKVGGIVGSANTNLQTATSHNEAAQSQRDQVSAVSLDEEFSHLIQYQRAFQANGRLIKVADELLQQIVNLI